MGTWNRLAQGWKSKVALFLVLKENDSSYNFVGNMLYQQLFDELLVEADQNYHGVLPIRVECWMDEFGNGLRPEGFEHLITTLRSRNIAVMLFLQSISQLQTMYKGDGWKVFMDSCAVFYFLVPAVVRMTPRKLSVKCWVLPQSKRHPVVFHTVKTEAAAQATIACSVRLWMEMKLHKMDKDSCIILPFASKPIIDKNISHSMIPLI